MTSPIDAMRADIIAQADAIGKDGWLNIPVPPEVHADKTLRVPRGAFEQWAVSRAGGGHLATPWRPVSPAGMKQDGDDVFHTDWMIGAGLPIDAMRSYGSNPHWKALSEAADDARFTIQNRLLNFRCLVLLPGPFVSGQIFVPRSQDEMPRNLEFPPVTILPDSRPEWIEIVKETLDLNGAVIVEKGGEMAHLITVMRQENQGPIVRIPNARAKYPPNATVYVHPDIGQVNLAEQMFSTFANNPDPFGDGSHYNRTAEDDPLPISQKIAKP